MPAGYAKLLAESDVSPRTEQRAIQFAKDAGAHERSLERQTTRNERYREERTAGTRRPDPEPVYTPPPARTFTQPVQTNASPTLFKTCNPAHRLHPNPNP